LKAVFMHRTFLLIGLIAAAGSAMAQNPQPTSPDNPSVPIAPPNSASPPPEQIVPPRGNPSGLPTHQQGAIKPPNVDPGMTVAPPNTSASIPVIHPPGSPGGNQSVIPK
jgi:hypothetical protein